MAGLLKQKVPILRRILSEPLGIIRKASNEEEVKPSVEHYDIIIGGGGLVGTALACALGKTRVLAEKRILLLDGAPPFKGFQGSQYGNRVSAINNSSVELFKYIGAWDKILNTRVKHVKQMQVWDACSDAQIDFHFEHFTKDLAYIVENDLMLDALYKMLNSNEIQNVKLRTQSRIESVQLSRESGEAQSKVCLADGGVATCDLIIGADGANSIVRKQMGVDVYSIDYERMAVVATLQLAEGIGDNSVAWQRFIPTGPVALLPLTDTMSSLVWSTTKDHAKHLLALSEEAFLEELNESFCKEYPKSDIVVNAVRALNSLMGSNPIKQFPPKACALLDKSRACFPLGFLHASSYVCAGAALVGDAAHRVHPLAGQGVNLGFSDVRNLVETLKTAAYAGARMGDKHYLIKYEQKSLVNNVPIIIGVHGLHSLYSTTFSPVVLLRGLGLQLTHNIPQIKNIFMQRAIG